jgi:hypothetical protein
MGLSGGYITIPIYQKINKLLIIKDILDKIIIFKPCNADTNTDMVFIIVFIGFLYIKEIIYPNKEVKDFNTIKALYSNIRITPNSYLIIFYLKWSKIDKVYNSINIQITTILENRVYYITIII